MLGVEFFLVDIFQGLSQNLGKLVKIRLGILLLLLLLARSILVAMAGVQIVEPLLVVNAQVSIVSPEVSDGDLSHLSNELKFQELPVVNFRLVQVKQEK